ncbi:hypothetical protein XarCFBP6762_21490, partial [Xanthomonas arboricola]
QGQHHQPGNDEGTVADAVDVAHARADRLAGVVDIAVFRGVRRGDRLAHGRHRRHQLRCLHHSRAGDAVP